MDSTASPSLVVCNDAGEVLRVPFGSERLIVGRSPQAPVRLDHGLVSRQHAELWRDAGGRYYVRDLQSRNGTLVNGQPITEASISPADYVGIGPFVLTILDHIPHTPGATSTRIILTDGAEGKISTLKDHASPRIDVAHLTTLNAFSQQLLATADAGARWGLLCKLMVGPQFRGQWGVVVRISRSTSDEAPELLCESGASQSSGFGANREPYLSRGVLRKVRDTGEAVLASNSAQSADQPMDIMVSISPTVVTMAVVACPIAQTATTMDVLYVMLPPTLGIPEWLALVNLAVMQFQQAEGAWAARKQAETIAVMERELAQARHIQMRLVPKTPNFAGLDVAIGFLPCLWVGGDYVDAVEMADGRTLLAIADVCGKGLPAALVASSVHTMVHSGVLSGLGLRELMSNLNRYLIGTLSGETFVTMIAIVIDPSTGQVEVVNAGHPPPLIMAPNQPPRRIDLDGNLPLSLERDDMVLHRIELGADELLTIYSDGLSELPDDIGGELGIKGLSAELHTIYTSNEIALPHAAEALSRRLETLQGARPAADDRTFLLARRSGK